ncbi:DUF3526 domain-containing protein [Roseateles cavernae]|uniref:DUF3526 domain-containing protein n=1 Tax=Roseateles cavernae TaxID=3153578 RepID=UPI0032E52A18
MNGIFRAAYFKAEWLRFSRDRANLLVLGILTLLCLIATANGWHGAQQRRQVQQQATASALERLARMQHEVASIAPDRPLIAQGIDPASPAKLANGDATFRVGLPPAAGAALALGTAALLPQSIEVSTRTRHTQAANQNIVNPALASSGSFDLAFVVVVLMPLAAIALAWRLQAHDRELGTWRLISAVPGAARGLFAAALLLRLALLCFAPLLGGALAVFGFAGFGSAAWLSWGSYALIVLLYALLWLVLAGLLNLTPARSQTLALSLVGLWLVAVFGVPAGIAAGAGPLPSRLATIVELRALDAVSRVDGEALEEGYRASHPEAMPGESMPQKGDHRIRLFSTQLAFDMKAAPIVAKVDAAVAQENERVERLSWLSPALAAQVALEQLAGNDLHRHQRFMAQVDAYQACWRDYFRPLVLSMRNMRATDYDGIPRFQFTGPPVLMPVSGLPQTAAAVAAWLLIAAAAVALARRRAINSQPSHLI